MSILQCEVKENVGCRCGRSVSSNLPVVSRRQVVLVILALATAGCGDKITLGDPAKFVDLENRRDEEVVVRWVYDGEDSFNAVPITLAPHTKTRTTVEIVGTGVRFVVTDNSGRTVFDRHYAWTDTPGGQPLDVVMQ